jgi:hypothetical protein
LEQGRQSGRTGIEVNAILGVNAVYVPTLGVNAVYVPTITVIQILFNVLIKEE